jgi:hypothetical protein
MNNKQKEQKNFIIHKNVVKTHYQSVVFKESTKLKPTYLRRDIYSYPLKRFKKENDEDIDFEGDYNQLLSYFYSHQDQRLLLNDNEYMIECRKDIETREIPESQQRMTRIIDSIKNQEEFRKSKRENERKPENSNKIEKSNARSSVSNMKANYLFGASRNFLIAAEENKIKEVKT